MTEKDCELIRLVAEEMSNREIAEKWGQSVRSVEQRKQRLFRQMGVKNSVGMVKKALETRLI